MLIVAKLFMNNFFFKVLIFLSEYPFRLVRFEISTRTENRTVLSRNIGTKRNGDFFLWIWDRILNFKIPNIWNGSGYLQIPDPPVPCTPLQITLEEVQVPENNEISISYVHRGEKWDRNNFDVNNIFAFQVALDIIQNDDDPEPQNTNECRQRNDWPKWREAMQAELHSLIKRDVFGPVVQTPASIKPVGNKWVFVRKRNENNDIIRYKARLVAQGFSQRPSIDYEETYSPVMDAITFRFLISVAVSEELDMRLMDVITAYLYGSIDSDIHMKIPE